MLLTLAGACVLDVLVVRPMCVPVSCSTIKCINSILPINCSPIISTFIRRRQTILIRVFWVLFLEG